MTGRTIDFTAGTEQDESVFIAHVQPGDLRRLVKEVAEAKELGWLRAGQARWAAVYDFLERVLGAEEYARLRALVADGVDENGYADDGDAQLDEIVDHLIAQMNRVG